MYQLWNNHCCNSFLANFISEVLNQQKLEMDTLMKRLKQQISEMTVVSQQGPGIISKEHVAEHETQKYKPRTIKPALVDKNIEKKNCSKRRRKNKQRCYIEGRWTNREHKLYLSFLDQNSQSILSSGDLKRQQKVFKQMSELIRSRTAAQCRSHHKKFDYETYLSQKKVNSDQSSQ